MAEADGSVGHGILGFDPISCLEGVLFAIVWPICLPMPTHVAMKQQHPVFTNTCNVCACVRVR